MNALDYVQTESSAYCRALQNLIAKNPDLATLIAGPIDHVAIKARDSAHYEELMAALLPFAKEASYITMNNRRLATLFLKEPLDLGQFGACNLVEIMEPRPEKVGIDASGFDHCEIVKPDYKTIQSVLIKAKIPFEAQENPNHKTLVMCVTDKQELKFSDMSLRDIVQKQKRAGEVMSIKTKLQSDKVIA